MTSNNSYFSHDSNARNDSKVVRLRMKHGAAGYGVYFMILERLREEKDYMSVKDYNMIAFDLRVDANLVKSVVEDFGLFAFTEDGECFYSESFNRRMNMKDDIKTKRAEAGRKGLAKRWGKSDEIANATETDSKTIANATETDSKTIANATETDSKESKVKERKEKEKKNSLHHDARAREPPDGNEKDWCDTLICNTQFVETVAMNHATTCDAVVMLIREFYSECAAKGTQHRDYNDFRRHCFDWARIHLEKQKQRQNGNQQRKSTNRHSAIEAIATRPQDYEGTF